MRRIAPLGLLLLTGCPLITDEDAAARLDLDGDGAAWPADCAPDDADIAPGVDEVCDGIDQDCDGEVDEDAVDRTEFYLDADGDGFGDAAATVLACSQPSGTARAAGDCDDSDDAMAPDHDEVCGDGLDNDCDGTRNDCRLEGAFGPDDADLVVLGSGADVQAGLSLAIGDVTGDGHADLAFGEPGANENWGAVVLLAGPLDGADLTPQAVYAETGDRTGLGRTVRMVDDVTGGGAELILAIGAPGDSSVAASSGRVDLVGVGDGRVDLPSAALGSIVSTDDYSHFGHDIVSVGDFAGDGVADLIVAANNADVGDANTGGIYAFGPPIDGRYAIGLATAKIGGTETSDWFGYRVVDVGDVDGDGVTDLAVSAPEAGVGATQEGAVHVVSSDWRTWPGIAGDADIVLLGGTEDALLGYGVAGPGDVDGDGHADLWLGAPGTAFDGASFAGAAWLTHGTLDGVHEIADVGVAVRGAGVYESVGWNVDPVGDVDEDGTPDLLVSGIGTQAGTGVGWLFYGPLEADATPDDADVTVAGDADGLYLGWAIGGGADLTGDGLPDLVLSAPGLAHDGSDFVGGLLVYAGVGL